MDDSYVLTSEKQPRKQIYKFFAKKWKKWKLQQFTGQEKLIDISNKLQDELLHIIADLSVIHYHSNEYYKPYILQAQRELENRKQNGHRTENNEAKNSVLVEQHRHSKRQKLNDNRRNECIICGNKTFRKDSKLTYCVKLKEKKLFLHATKFNMDAGNFIFLKLLSINFHYN